MDTEQRLRTALQRGAGTLHLPEGGPQGARRRARQRERRRRSMVGALTALAVVGGALLSANGLLDRGLLVTLTPGGEDQPTDPLLEQAGLDEFIWREADGVVGSRQQMVLGSDGAYYSLSTAPGTSVRDYPDGVAPQALYRSEDGLSWGVVELGDEPRIAGFGERDGLLYALSTAPAASGGELGWAGVSEDGGRTWQRADLPSEALEPDATVPLGGPHASVRLAVGEELLVASLRTSYFLDGADVFGAELTPSRHWLLNEDGIALVETDELCDQQMEDGVVHLDSAEPADTGSAPVPDEGQPVPACQEQMGREPVRTVAWRELGLDGPEDLVLNELFVSADGIEWDRLTDDPFGERRVAELTATPDGFVAVTLPTHEPGGAELHRSTDGRDWQAVGPGPGAFLGVVGSRFVATGEQDHERLVVATSDDSGETWSTTDLSAVADPDNRYDAIVGARADAGPLGVAILAVGIQDRAGADAEFFLVTSPDAMTWSVTPLTDIVDGQPPVDVGWIAVGEDSIAFSAVWPSSDESGELPSRTFVGTPQR